MRFAPACWRCWWSGGSGRAGAPPAALVLAILVLAAGEAVFRPALAATLPILLPDRALLPAANALFDTTERSARLVGPGLVGVLAGFVPVVHFFTLDAATFILSASAVLSLGRFAAAPHPRSSARPGLGRGFAEIRRHRLLWSVLVCSGPINGLWVAAFYLALPLLIERLGITGPGRHGARRLRPRHIGPMAAPTWWPLWSSVAVLCPAIPAAWPFSAPSSWGRVRRLWRSRPWLGLPGMMAASAFAAIGGPMKDIPVAVLRQTELPAGTVASAMRAFMVASYAGVLTAMTVAPVVGRSIGPGWLLAICGGGLLAFAGWGLRRHWGDGRAEPSAAVQHTSTVSPSSAP